MLAGSGGGSSGEAKSSRGSFSVTLETAESAEETPSPSTGGEVGSSTVVEVSVAISKELARAHWRRCFSNGDMGD